MSLEESGVSAACFAEVMQLRPDGAHQNHTKSILLPTCIVCPIPRLLSQILNAKNSFFKSFDFSSVICTSRSTTQTDNTTVSDPTIHATVKIT